MQMGINWHLRLRLEHIDPSAPEVLLLLQVARAATYVFECVLQQYSCSLQCLTDTTKPNSKHLGSLCCSPQRTQGSARHGSSQEDTPDQCHSTGRCK